MKAVILAGGYGTRISEESYLRPKPMIEIGEMPILWHIMKIYSHYGIREFVICAGYKQHVIKQWFSEYLTHSYILRMLLLILQREISSWCMTSMQRDGK